MTTGRPPGRGRAECIISHPVRVGNGICPAERHGTGGRESQGATPAGPRSLRTQQRKLWQVGRPWLSLHHFFAEKRQDRNGSRCHHGRFATHGGRQEARWNIPSRFSVSPAPVQRTPVSLRQHYRSAKDTSPARRAGADQRAEREAARVRRQRPTQENLALHRQAFTPRNQSKRVCCYCRAGRCGLAVFRRMGACTAGPPPDWLELPGWRA
jgi:hypothetical protein